jgi:hypothetical protein
VVHRRNSNLSATEMAASESLYFLPHIVGQVLEESTLSVIPDVEVSLRLGDAPAVMVDSDWDNPYKINAAVKGHYHFWPYYSESSMGKSVSVKFTLFFHHPDFAQTTLGLELKAVLKSERVKTQFIPLVLMSAKDAGGKKPKK